jgi:hypothetical protein
MIRLLFGCHYFQFINGKSEKPSLKVKGSLMRKSINIGIVKINDA